MAAIVDNAFDRQHLRNLNAYKAQIDEIFREAAREAALIGVSLGEIRPDKPFSFTDYPLTRKKIEKLLQRLKNSITTTIVNGVRSEWTLANNKNNELCRQVFGDSLDKVPKDVYRRNLDTNSAAEEAFLKRKEAGLGLSDRVWNYTDQFKEEIEMGLDLGIRSGASAEQMSRELRGYLKKPDKLFRRVRDEHGQLQLSKNAKAYHPGQGVYRSSYKNALRLTGTETNIAYRTADYLRWQQMDSVVGIEVRLSNNHTIKDAKGKLRPLTDICDTLAGKYPKDFKFVGWHPQCRCHAVPIMKTQEEIIEDTKRILAGKKPLPPSSSKNYVKEPHEGFSSWAKDNAERIEAARGRGKLPYFLRDNDKLIHREPVRSIHDIAKARHAARTPEQIDKIKHDYWMRWEPEDLTQAQKEANIAAYLQIERDMGVKRGRPMTFEEADRGTPNPNYSPFNPKRQAYRENCQASVLAFEMRRRGFDVEALGYTRGSMLVELAKNPRLAWNFGGYTPHSEGIYVGKNMMKDFGKYTSRPGRYALTMNFEDNKRFSHIISFERMDDGTVKFHDPQCAYSFASLKTYAKKNSIDFFSVYRIDDCTPNALWVKGCLTPSGAKATTAQVGRRMGTQGVRDGSWFERYNAANTKSERVALLKEQVVSGGYARLNYHSSKSGSIFGIGMGDFDRALTQKEMPKNLALARKLIKHGHDVFLMPNPHGIASADYILCKNGKLIYAEGKRMDGENSLDHLLEKGTTQSSTIVVDIVGNQNTNYVYSNVKTAFERNGNLSELILFKGSRNIVVRRQNVMAKNFEAYFQRIWSKAK